MKKFKFVLLAFFVLISGSLTGCSNNSEEYFSNWKFVYLDFDDADDIVCVQYTLTNTTKENWKYSGIGYTETNELTLGENEYNDWYYPHNADPGGKKFMGFDSSTEPSGKGLMAGKSATYMVCYKVNEFDFNENMKDAEMHVEYDYVEYTKKGISYDDFTIIHVGSKYGTHNLSDWQY